MEIGRREFLKASGAGVGGIFLLGSLNPSTAITDNLSSLARPSSEKAILYDSTQCVGCHFCEAACKKENELEGKMTAGDKLSPNTWLKIVKTKPRQGDEEAELSQIFPELSQLFPDSNWFFRDCMRQACMHCTDATCVKVCPTGALYHHELGFVGYDKGLCSGCGYCVDFCPFNVPRCKRNLLTGVAKMDKCTFCSNRIANGNKPVCVEVCPVGALTYDDRDKLIAKGEERVQVLKTEGYSNAYLYGEKELGGLHVMYVLNDFPEVYGLPTAPKVPVTATVWQDILQPLGWVLGGLAILGLGSNYFIARKSKLDRNRKEKKGE